MAYAEYYISDKSSDPVSGSAFENKGKLKSSSLNVEGVCQDNEQVQQISSLSMKQNQEDLYLEMTEAEEVEEYDGKCLISHISVNL